jgi:hypothetical protein
MLVSHEQSAGQNCNIKRGNKSTENVAKLDTGKQP